MTRETTTETRETLLADALESLNEARSRYFAAKTKSARIEADEDVQFWSGRASMYSTEKGWNRQ